MMTRAIRSRLSRRRPFCLLGAAGTGKSTLLMDFAGSFSDHIILDLATAVDRRIFANGEPPGEVLKAISFLKEKEIRGSGTLIILEEIGRCPEAVTWVKAMDSERPEPGPRTQHPAIAATSRFFSKETVTLCDPGTGAMEPVFLHPLTFAEFLEATGDPGSLAAFHEVPIPYYAYDKLLHHFHRYALIGGMPAIVASYAEKGTLSALKKTYGILEDHFTVTLSSVGESRRTTGLASEILRNCYPFAATRISFNRFSNIESGSREISRAFSLLQRAFLVDLTYPVTSPDLPPLPDRSRFPRLHVLDTGLVCFNSGIQRSLYESNDMVTLFQGQLARQAVGQEISASAPEADTDKASSRISHAGKWPLHFWIREKAQSKAEVDFVIPFRDILIPVVVKSGEPGRLRSLHEFMDLCPHPFAVRLHGGQTSVQQASTIRGKKYFLLSLPYFLAGRIREHLGGFIRLSAGG